MIGILSDMAEQGSYGGRPAPEFTKDRGDGRSYTGPVDPMALWRKAREQVVGPLLPPNHDLGDAHKAKIKEVYAQLSRSTGEIKAPDIRPVQRVYDVELSGDEIAD